mmetsp:Transcript_6538/g.13722  ORF Transcript_6538/g.13722 Transcript_6538/m.13722 type:complete len:100 (-) Transcript_6538:129-428(-)
MLTRSKADTSLRFPSTPSALEGADAAARQHRRRDEVPPRDAPPFAWAAGAFLRGPGRKQGKDGDDLEVDAAAMWECAFNMPASLPRVETRENKKTLASE